MIGVVPFPLLIFPFSLMQFWPNVATLFFLCTSMLVYGSVQCLNVKQIIKGSVTETNNNHKILHPFRLITFQIH